MQELLERFGGDPTLAKLLTGMIAALDAMEAIRQEALDICKLQHGEKLRPKFSSVDIHDVVEVKLRAVAEHIPRGNVKVNGSTPHKLQPYSRPRERENVTLIPALEIPVSSDHSLPRWTSMWATRWRATL